MSQPASNPSANLRGAVDLSALTRPAPGPEATAGAAGAGGVVVDVTEETFPELMQTSMTVPVVIDLWATWCEPCKQLSPVLERLAVEYGGRFLLAKIDIDANPQIAQAFQVQSVPMVVALIKGQPVPLFNGAVPETDIRQVLDQVMQVAEANGVTGTIDVTEATADDSQPAEPELPARHREAVDAIERGDLAAAAVAYRQAIKENPADEDARIGLVQVELMQRTETLDPTAIATADANPTNADAQLAAADADLVSGRPEQAFARLIQAVKTTTGDDRDRCRTRLLELFEVVGATDPRVTAARQALAAALF